MLRAEFEKRLGSFHLHVQLQTDGGTLGLLGASGSGKSMTLKCIAGILRPDRGHIELDGTVLFDSARGIDLPPQRRRVGYLFQNYALFPNMTARQNILCALHALPRSARAAQAQALLARFHLEDAAQLYPAQLSGGQQQRVALARILAAQPRAVLLDEPLSALDPFLRWQLELELAQLLEDFDGARLWVTHDAGECRRNCEHVCVLEQGQSDAVLPAAQLFSHPQTVAQARLIGCRSFYTLEGGAVPQLGLHVSNTHARVLGVPQAAVIPGTALHCRVLRVLDEPDGQLALLHPLDAPADTPPLCAALRDAPDALPPRLTCGDEIAVSLHPDRLLFFQR